MNKDAWLKNVEQPTKIKLKPRFWITKYCHHCGVGISWARASGWRGPRYYHLHIGHTTYHWCLFNYELRWNSDIKIVERLKNGQR